MAKEKSTLGNVLVTGGCGFLGRTIVAQLEERYNCSISVIDLKTNLHRIQNVTYYDADITSPSKIQSVFETVKPDYIIHTASPTAVSDGSSRMRNNVKSLYYKVNVEGTRNLLDQAAKVGTVKGFIYTSSASIIHDGRSDLVDADERWPVLHPPVQQEYYSHTKALAEELVLAANRKHNNMLTLAIRPAGLFGEGDMQVTANLLTMWEKGQHRIQLGDNDNLFDFTYVGNAAYAHILGLIALVRTRELPTDPLDHEKVDGEAFLITNGEPTYMWDFARGLLGSVGDTTDYTRVWTLSRENSMVIAFLLEWIFWLAGGWTPNLDRKKVRYICMTRYYNINKARLRLQYKPRWTLGEAFERTGKHYLQLKEAEKAKKGQ